MVKNAGSKVYGIGLQSLAAPIGFESKQNLTMEMRSVHPTGQADFGNSCGEENA